MSQTSIDLTNLFVRSPGELIYFVVVIAISLASLFMALGERTRDPSSVTVKRLSLALLGVVAAWMALMTGALLTLTRDLDPTEVLPPLERFVSFLTLVFVGWGLLSFEPLRQVARGSAKSGATARRQINLIALLLVVAASVGYAVTVAQWQDLAGETDFNLSVPGVSWMFASFLVSLLGLIVLILNARRVLDSPLKALFFLLMGIGYGLTLVQVVRGDIVGDYAGVMRLAFVGGMLLVPAVVYRAIMVSVLSGEGDRDTARTTVLPTIQTELPPREPVAQAPVLSPVERESVQLMRALGIMLEDATPSTMSRRILQALIEVVKVDITALLRLKDANYADVEVAVDRYLGRELSGMAINLDNQPTLANSIERKLQRSLLVDRNEDELRDLYARLDIEQIGPAYIQPVTREGKLLGVLIAALPYSNRELLRAEAELLKGVAVIAGGLLDLSDAATESQLLAEERAIQAMVTGVVPGQIEDQAVISARQELQSSLKLARDQIAELSKQVVSLKLELDRERNRIADALGDDAEALSISQRISVINEQQDKLRAERDALAERLREAEAALHGALNTSDETYYNDLVQTLQRDKEDLVAQRDLLQTELEALRGSSDGLVSPQDMRAMVARMEQERARLEADREQMASRLADIQEQLEAAGVETGPGGLAQLISQLTEQRGTLVSENETLRREVERLQSAAAEVADIDDAAREERIHLLENTLKNLASDREAAIKQRDHIRKELDEFKHKLTVLRARWKDLEAKLERAQKELKISQQQRNKLQDEIWQMANQRSELVNLRDRLAAEKQAVETERDQLLARIEGDRSRVEELGATGVGSLTGMIEDLTEQRQSLENQLQQAQIRISELESTLERARAEAFDQADVRYRPDNPDLLLGLVQELRTPMTSITGYVDLLLGESAGILGEMQRKFLQRVSTNVTRLDSMLDDLIKVTELDTGHYRFTPVPVNVNNLIEDAITHASNQFREKGLTVSLALDDTLPPVQVDRDAISQIVGQLLTNAYLASPPDSEIIIRSEARDADLWGIGAVECLIVSVEDRGGGISPEDEPRVFARKYKAENPLIQGLGDTGVGLSIAKALVESQGGRLWLETRENVGSTFTFLLPFVPIQNPQQAAEAEPNDAS